MLYSFHRHCALVLPLLTSLFLMLSVQSLRAEAEFKALFTAERPAGAILFIHGLWGDPDASFTHSGSGAYWPDLVRRDTRPIGSSPPLSAYNILTLKHSAGTRRSPLSLENAILDSIEAIRILERDTKPPKYIIVAHSFGGLIAKRIFTHPRLDLQKKLHAIFLFAVPSNGRDLGWAKPLANLVDRQISDLDGRANNLWVMQNENDYSQQFDSRKGSLPKIYCAFETLDTPVPGYFLPVRILEWKDAVTRCDKETSFTRNHITIVKMASVNDPVYEWFRNMLIDIAQSPVAAPIPAPPADKADFEDARTKDTISALRKYKAEHPSGQFLREADIRIGQLEEAERDRVAITAAEDKAFNDAKVKNTLDSFRDYIRRYPAGRYLTQAQAFIGQLESARAPQKEEPTIAGAASQERLHAMLIWLGHLDGEAGRVTATELEAAVRRFEVAIGKTPDGALTASELSQLREKYQAVKRDAQLQRVRVPQADEIWLPTKMLPVAEGEDLKYGRRFESHDGDLSVDVVQLKATEWSLERLKRLHCCQITNRKQQGPIEDRTKGVVKGIALNATEGNKRVSFRAFQHRDEIRALAVTYNMAREKELKILRNVIVSNYQAFSAQK